MNFWLIIAKPEATFREGMIPEEENLSFQNEEEEEYLFISKRRRARCTSFRYFEINGLPN